MAQALTPVWYRWSEGQGLFGKEQHDRMASITKGQRIQGPTNVTSKEHASARHSASSFFLRNRVA
jgi:hypothetical protein